jgi:hypothetical protein
MHYLARAHPCHPGPCRSAASSETQTPTKRGLAHLLYHFVVHSFRGCSRVPRLQTITPSAAKVLQNYVNSEDGCMVSHAQVPEALAAVVILRSCSPNFVIPRWMKAGNA